MNKLNRKVRRQCCTFLVSSIAWASLFQPLHVYFHKNESADKRDQAQASLCVPAYSLTADYSTFDCLVCMFACFHVCVCVCVCVQESTLKMHKSKTSLHLHSEQQSDRQTDNNFFRCPIKVVLLNVVLFVNYKNSLIACYSTRHFI